MLKAVFLRRVLTGRNIVHSFNRTYLSQEFLTTMGKRLDIPQLDRSTKKLFGQQSETLFPFEIDSFINRLPENDDRRGEIYEQLLKLRTSEYATNTPDTLHHSVINYLVSVDVEDLLLILSNRLQYGIFLDEFSGCYLMDTLLEKKNFAGAAQIAVELLIQEDYDNELVQALALKSSFEYVNEFLNNFQTKPVEETPTEEKSEKPIKVRVKYLRNPPENEMINSKVLSLSLIGNTIEKFSSKCSHNDLKQNGTLFGNVLAGNLETIAELLKTNAPVNYSKDIIDLCLSVLENHSSQVDENVRNSLKQSLEKLKSNSTKLYTETLDGFIQQARTKNETSLIEKQNENYTKWLNDREERLNGVIRDQKQALKQSEIEKTVADIETERQKLWFFENQDKLDMDIFKKQVRYPKRWFGKKKKPRAVDDNYVPPEIRPK